MPGKTFITVASAMIVLFSWFSGSAVASPKKIQVGFLYVSPISDAGYTYAHDQGRRMVEKMPGVSVKFIESVDEGIQSEPILEFMASKGYNLIFATSYGYMDHVIKIAKMYPDTIFMHCSGYKRAKNVGTYFGRMYQARYLTGMVAGAMTKTQKIGYVAAYPIPEVIRGINAFALGARSVQPEIEIRVAWTHTWYDPVKEKKTALELLDAGIDLITQHQDSPATQVAAQDRGVFSIGYNTNMRKFAPSAYLTAPVWKWDVIYRYVVERVQSGDWKSEDIWWGLKEGAVDIAPMAQAVPKETQRRVMAARDAMIKGRRFVFTGPVRDQNGVVRIAPGTKATDEALLNMKWFVSGVIGSME